MPNEPEPNASSRRRFSIGFLLWLVAIFAIGFAAYSRWHARRVIQQSHDAEVALLTQTLRKYVTYTGPPPMTPFYDDDGNVHPNSCGPSVDFSDSKWTKAHIRRELHHLKALLPDDGKSHVGLYLNENLSNDDDFVDELRRVLPGYEIYDRTTRIRYWGIPPF